MVDNTVPIAVLDHGKVELVDYMGSDLAIVQAAQSSFNRISLKFGDREYRILRSLMREEHGVPFETAVLKFRLKMPIFVARQLVKHRMSSWDEESARYSTMGTNEVHLPDVEQVRIQVGKAMDYTYSQADFSVAEEFLRKLANWCLQGQQNYQWALDLGVAKEQARMFLPINTFTTVTWTMNARAFLNMVRLRNDDHTQWETRQYAIAMEALAETIIPETMKAFNEFGRKVP